MLNPPYRRSANFKVWVNFTSRATVLRSKTRQSECKRQVLQPGKCQRKCQRKYMNIKEISDYPGNTKESI